VAWSIWCDISELAGITFSGLSSLAIEDATDRDGVIVVRARTGHVHRYYERTVADVRANGRPVMGPDPGSADAVRGLSTQPGKQTDAPQAEVIEIRKLDKIETTYLCSYSN
jgi:hypothetical protein